MAFLPMALQEFNDRIDDLEDEIKDFCSDEAVRCYPVYDGPINVEQYYNAPTRIVWLLKEAYEEYKDGQKEGWYYSDFFPEDICSFVLKHKSRRTWQPIAYASYSILNGLPLFDYMDWLRDKPEMAQAIKSVAVVNTKKLPGASQSNDGEIAAAFQRNQSILKKQLDLLKPDVIIGGKTLSLYYKLLNLESSTGTLKNSGRPFFIAGGKLYIDAYHPAQRGDIEKYVDDIVGAARAWRPDLVGRFNTV
jgi:hypothetical protein